MSNNGKNLCGTDTAKYNEIFNEMLRLTVRIFGLSSNDLQCSRGAKKRWEDLADIWVKYANEDCEYSIFELALHKIYWGIYPNYTDDRHIPLLQLVEKELVSDGPAYQVWRYHKAYREAFKLIKNRCEALVKRGPRPHSYIFASYQNSRFWYKVVFKGRAPENVNPATASMRELKAAKIHADIYIICNGFEKVINCLIPASVNWTDEQWLNDLNIRRALKQLYGYTCKPFERDFEVLMIALINKLYHNAPIFLGQLLSLSSLPMSMVQRIWPNETAGELNKMFLQAGSRAQCSERKLLNGTSHRAGLYSYKRLQNSWLYAYISSVYAHYKPKSAIEKKVRKRLYMVTANIV